MQELIEKVKQWHYDRNLVKGSTPQTQIVKLLEEFGELASGISKCNHDQKVDSLGDMLVVMVLIAEQIGVSLEECLQAAYDEIKDRKGRMIDGTFVKESDLPETKAECPPNGEL